MFQGIVDILVMGNYLIFWTLRRSRLLNYYYFRFESYYLAAWCFNQTYISVIIRCFGVLLLSFQRYISMCLAEREIQVINASHRWTLPILHWALPAVYSIPLLAITDVSFDSVENLEVIAQKQDITVMAIHRVCGRCRRARGENLYVRTTSRKAIIFQDGPVFTMRIVFPVVSCFLSYVNVWMTLLLNDDIRRKILIMLGFQKPRHQVSPSVVKLLGRFQYESQKLSHQRLVVC
ncbi:unnamed protein product [Heligmosomoides polygyrus]|uniref:G_PROTEIN_RECEP_F1_2 domain-containing protein n=1 Tax=Heligmosomoides polygyrus TaxID=6339 RepID=A0A3P8DTB8_HELPZ|nr:unnamed protein product [Heligmosomoides polygyrus]